MRVVPTGPTAVTTEYQVFRNLDSGQGVFQRAADFFEGIELEDYDLMNGAQKNLNSGVYVRGPCHTTRESGVLYFKHLVKEQLMQHFQQEKEEGREIWPAKRKQQLHAEVDKLERFCDTVCSRGEKFGATTDIEDM